MLPGRMRDRVGILSRITTPTPTGTVEDWVQTEERWARIVPVSISAQANFMQVHESEITHSVTFKSEIALTIADHRLKFNGQHYEIVDPAFDPSIGLGKYTRVMAKLVEQDEVYDSV